MPSFTVFSTSFSVLFLLLQILNLSNGQFYFHDGIGSGLDPFAFPYHHLQASSFYRQQRAPQPPPDYSRYAHKAVIENSIRESKLPAEYIRSSRFYNDPRIAAALAKESLLTDKETPVIDRDAEKIPREQIVKLFKNAGFIRRR